MLTGELCKAGQLSVCVIMIPKSDNSRKRKNFILDLLMNLSIKPLKTLNPTVHFKITMIRLYPKTVSNSLD